MICKEKGDKRDFMKIRDVRFTEDTVKRLKRQATDWGHFSGNLSKGVYQNVHL